MSKLFTLSNFSPADCKKVQFFTVILLSQMQQGTYETPLYKHNPLTHQLIGACVWWEKNLRLGVQRSEIIRCLLQPFPGKNSHPLDNILCSLLLCAFLFYPSSTPFSSPTYPPFFINQEIIWARRST